MCGDTEKALYSIKPNEWYQTVPTGVFCLTCVNKIQLKMLAENIEGEGLNGDDTQDGICILAQPLRLTKINTLVGWMKQGVGPTNGGDCVGTMPIGDRNREFDIYMDNIGIYGVDEYPGYFYDNAGNWYRVAFKDLYLLSE